MYVNMKELKKHAILGFKIGGVLKTRIVPGMFLSSKITKFLLPSPRCVDPGIHVSPGKFLSYFL
jgi:hypothetical protein